jgi:WD40 repeat protein
MARLRDLVNVALESRPLSAEGGVISPILFSPDGRWLFAASLGDSATLWDLSQPGAEPYVLAGLEGGVQHVEFSHDSHLIATYSRDQALRVWSLQYLDITPSVLGSDQATTNVIGMAFTEDDHWLATMSGDGSGRLWYIASQADERLILSGGEDLYRAAIFSDDKRWLAMVSIDGDVSIWSTDDLTSEARVLPSSGSTNSAISFSPDSRFLALASDEGTVLLHDIVDPEKDAIVLRSRTGSSGAPGALRFSPDGRQLTAAICASNDHTVVVFWDLDDTGGKPIVRDLEYTECPTPLTISNDSRWLAIGTSSPSVWDLSDLGTKPVRLTGPERTLSAMAFSHRGKALAAAYDDGAVHLWNLRKPTAQPVVFDHREERVAVRSFAGVSVSRDFYDQMFALAFSHDARLLASAGGDGAVRMWSVQDPASQPVVLNTGALVFAMAFDSGDRWLATGTYRGPAMLWHLSADDLIEKACLRARRNFTRDEWNRHFPDDDYHTTCPDQPTPPSISEERTSVPAVSQPSVQGNKTRTDR